MYQDLEVFDEFLEQILTKTQSLVVLNDPLIFFDERISKDQISIQCSEFLFPHPPSLNQPIVVRLGMVSILLEALKLS